MRWVDGHAVSGHPASYHISWDNLLFSCLGKLAAGGHKRRHGILHLVPPQIAFSLGRSVTGNTFDSKHGRIMLLPQVAVRRDPVQVASSKSQFRPGEYKQYRDSPHTGDKQL